METGDNRSTSFLDNSKPQLQRSHQQIEEENNYLHNQLDERDSVIRLLKSEQGKTVVSESDELINSLNLRLAQKNVLMDRILKKISGFEETVGQQNIRLHPLCV